MKNYRMVVEFHAEDDADAQEQATRSLDAFDDGHGTMTLHETTDRLVFVSHTIEADV
jgi:hypothetical protein